MQPKTEQEPTPTGLSRPPPQTTQNDTLPGQFNVQTDGYVYTSRNPFTQKNVYGNHKERAPSHGFRSCWHSIFYIPARCSPNVRVSSPVIHFVSSTNIEQPAPLIHIVSLPRNTVPFSSRLSGLPDLAISANGTRLGMSSSFVNTNRELVYRWYKSFVEHRHTL